MKIRSTIKQLAAPAFVAVASALSAFISFGASPAYPPVVIGDGALGYYRFNDSLVRGKINVNSGTLGAAGNATNDLSDFGVVHPFPGAIVGNGNRSEFFDFTTRSEIPFNAALNTPNTKPFTVEGWFYPASDQTATGMAPLANRWTQGGNRQGWVMYQRKPNADYFGGEPVGWEVRMYNDLDGGGHLDVVSLVPYEVGKWTYIAFVYDPIGGDATNSTLTIYIDGVPANTNINVAPIPGYAACTGTHDPAPNGQPAMALGNYNNANTTLNPWFGAVDEYAWYSNKLSPAQILAHYQNGTNAARSTPYDTLIKSHNPVVYLRLDEIAAGANIAVNMGDLRSTGNATNASAVKRPGTSALVGRTDDGSFSGKPQGSTPTGNSFADIPWTAENNPSASVPFTLEGWFRPMNDQTSPGPCPINNRLAQGVGQPSGAANRTGWVIYQRCPNATYSPTSGESAIGWAMRMYRGETGSGDDVITGAPNATSNPDAFGYTVGQWQHVVFTWVPVQNNGITSSGSEQWQGTLTAYTNGVAAATNETARYAANVSPTEDGRPPADFAVGMYNLASQGGGIEEFRGDIDEVAFYNNYALTPEQILEHYQAGTNSHPGTNYETLVLTAGFTGPERAGLPKTYLRFSDAAYFPAVNSGSLGYLADGSLVLTTNIGAGPITTGFESPNPAVPVDGVMSWASLNNPSGLNISGQITLEAWINPAASQGTTGRIISHGPPVHTYYDPNAFAFTLSGSLLNSNEVSLRIEGSGATYAVGSSNGSTSQGASAAVTAGDLGGANGWIHLAGTYDGANWRLYRNGVQIASAASGVGALPVSYGEWAIGATGMGWGDLYSGGIDEAAIYNTALSANTVKAHYYVGVNGTVSLTIVRSGSSVTVTWPAGTLQQADNVTGPYTDVLVLGVPATSPYTPAAPLATKKFYRVKL